MKKPWVESQGQIGLFARFDSQIWGQTAKIQGEIFTFLCQPAKGPFVQALEIIRHVDASFYTKKSRWDYRNAINIFDINMIFVGGQ